MSKSVSIDFIKYQMNIDVEFCIYDVVLVNDGISHNAQAANATATALV